MRRSPSSAIFPAASPSEERGEQGFSYDPIFVYEPRGLTFGELSEQEKNAVSHRARAVQAAMSASASFGPQLWRL